MPVGAQSAEVGDIDKARIAGLAGLAGHPVLLFDGVCGLCNRTVRFLVRRDPEGVLRFVPLESALGQHLLAAHGMAGRPEGVVLIADGVVSQRSDAIGDALRVLPAPWPAMGWLLQRVPRFLREFVYGWIARWRYRVFGRYESCPIPTAEERGRIVSEL